MLTTKFLLILAITYTSLVGGIKPERHTAYNIIPSAEAAALHVHYETARAKRETKDINYGPWFKVEAVLYEVDLEGGRIRKVGIPAVKIGTD